MDYPILQWTWWGGGLLIALVATIHVFIAHFAVGGGLFIAVMETRVQRLGLGILKDYLRRYAKFFLVFTMVVGGLTGVGIWVVIAIGAPGATSTLIHSFVFGWATEWTFFLAEIVTLLVYMSSFEAERSTRRLILAWLYFAFAFGSLTVVQGFISYMLTPGEWLATQRFWDGFFNPTFLPGLVFRAAFAALVAGVFGLITAQGVDDETERRRLSRFCAVWAILPLPVLAASGWWHIAVLSPEQKVLALGLSPEVAAGMKAFWWAAPVVVAGGALLAGGLSRGMARNVAVVTMLASFCVLASFEYMREAARRPYLITGYMYSNGIPVARAGEINAKGALASAKWSKVKQVTDENRMEAGRELYYLECSSCHSLGGPMLDMLPRSAKYTAYGMETLLTGMGKIGTYMPPFLGIPQEKAALAAWLTEGLHGPRQEDTPKFPQSVDAVPVFTDDSPYVLTAAPDRGINLLSDADGQWTLGIGAQGLTAQLIRRDISPEAVTKGVTMTYTVADGQAGSLQPQGNAFRAELIPVSPYPKSGGFQPYPVAEVNAYDASGKLLASTRVVLPVSTELGCRSCHGGPWKHGVAGIAPPTGRDVLAAHDRLSGTRLGKSSGTIECRSCHKDAAEAQAASPAAGSGRTMSLSASIHGLHAVYLAGQGAKACDACHPTSPAGATRAFRDPHQEAGLDCTNCHGALEDHALSLLTREKALGAPAAAKLMGLITPRDAQPVAREPWAQEPRCLTCHVDYGPPQGMQAYGTWNKDRAGLFKNSRDEIGAMACSGCHSSVHAAYPARNPYGKIRDVLQPTQYQKNTNALGSPKTCKVCHTMDMDAPAHHPGMGLD
ncbi:MAG: multiheme c-type cytochrome [Acidobacteriota bacterium]